MSDDVASIFDQMPQEIKDLLVRIRISIPGRKPIYADYRPMVEISYEHLEEQLARTPSDFAFWGNVHAEQKMIVDIQELNLRKRKAEVATAMMEQAKKENISPRRSDIADVLETDEEVIKMQAKLAIEERSLNKMNVLMEALRMKSEHLRSLSGFKKQEMRDA